MVVLFVVATILLFLGIDFLLRKRQTNRNEITVRAPHALFNTLNRLPSGVFLQRGFTWTRLLEDGSVAVGLQPILTGITGAIDEVLHLEEGQEVKKGHPVIALRKGDAKLRIPAPVSGTVSAINHQYNYTPGNNDSWLMMVKPADVPKAVRSWMVAEEASAWSKKRFNEVRDFFGGVISHSQEAVTMADGGDLPEGILQQFEKDVWDSFQSTFINQTKPEK